MSIDQATVRHIARLARISVSDEEAKQLEGELSSILTWVEQLEAVDTDGVSPMTSVVDVEMKRRVDSVTDGGIPDDVLANAPETAGGFYSVPKVVE